MAMLFPTYGDIINHVNETSEDGTPIIESRYSVVVAASKRARQLVDGAETDGNLNDDKALTVAINELNTGAIRVTRKPEED